MRTFDITPATKIGALLDAYPEIESFLIQLVPAFEKLKNPVLRKTVAKVASLEQASKVGNVPLPYLINSIREKLGYDSIGLGEINDSLKADFIPDKNRVCFVIDGEALINKGEKPITTVMHQLKELQGDMILQFDCPFYPSPLIEKAESSGYLVCSECGEDSKYCIYFIRRN